MRIVYLADIHGATKNVERLLEITEADLYIITGDLVNRPFRLYKDFFRFIEVEQQVKHLKCKARTEVLTFYFAQNALKKGECGPGEAEIIEEYIFLYKRAQKTMKKRLAELGEVFQKFEHKTIFTLPGNYDSNLRESLLAPSDLHQALVTVGGIRIAGYGGANVQTPGVPEGLAVEFNESSEHGTLVSEPRDFFSLTRPHIAVTHVPPYGFFDALPHKNVGSLGIRDYMDQFQPKMILCGHVHENWGVALHRGTIIVNPSNFGKTEDLHGARRGGYFFDFIVEETQFKAGTLRYLERGKVRDIKDYIYESGSLKELTIDRKSLSRINRKKHLDRDVLHELRDFQKVRDFFREYETPETKQRIQDLRNIYRKLAKSGQDIAFDVLGSVNFGMSESGSDVDLVMYRRCACKKPLPETECTLPRTLFQLFEMLEERYKVEVLDCINLNRVDASIREADPECPALQRFVLYRAIGRPVNLRRIRETETLLDENPALKAKVERYLREYIHFTAATHSHINSFKKYQVRLNERGIELPSHIISRLDSYLHSPKN